MKLENELKGFIGTTQYHKTNPFSKLVVTDGILHLCENAKCYWLIDIVASVQHLEKIQQNKEFILWVIDVKDKKAVVKALTDSDGEVLYEQKVEYTDFPLKRFEFYQEQDVALLKNEH
tara:strand:+ start:328 stop:681 length:354 start_codon:yes stop_codon:yes gene_type:complete